MSNYESDFDQAEVDGATVSVAADGLCWYCEDATPTIASRASLGPFALDIGVCEDCHQTLKEKA